MNYLAAGGGGGGDGGGGGGGGGCGASVRQYGPGGGSSSVVWPPKGSAFSRICDPFFLMAAVPPVFSWSISFVTVSGVRSCGAGG